MSQGDWVHLGRGHPCPICGQSSRCSIHKSGAYGFCRVREANEGREPFIDSTGQASWRFDLGSLAGRQHTPLIASRHCASDEILDWAYSLVLRWACNETHLRDLCRRFGVAYESRHLLPLGDYASLDRVEVGSLLATLSAHLPISDILSIPGIIENENKTLEFSPKKWKRNGILIACRNAKGQITALKCRLDHPLPGGDRYLMVSSLRYGGAGPRAAIHFPDSPSPTDDTIRVSEGEIKSSIATFHTDILTVSLPGVSNWKSFLPEIEQLAHVRRVLVAFDSDVFSKPQVARSLYELVQDIWASQKGYSVGLEVWDKQYKGIDDLLIAGGKPVIFDGDQAHKLIQQIGQTAGLELESEQFADIVHRVKETLNPMVLTEPSVLAFAATLNDSVRFVWDTEMRMALGTKYKKEAFWHAAAGHKRDVTNRGVVDENRLPTIETYSRATALISMEAVSSIYARNDPPRIFYFGNNIARVQQPSHGSNYEIDILDQTKLKAELERVAEWYRTPADKAVKIPCPDNTARDLLAYPEAWNGLPRVEGIVGYPIFNNEGHLIDLPGYNPSSRMVFKAAEGLKLLPIPEKVTPAHIAWAKSVIEFLLTDFKFTTTSSRAYAYALFLLQPARALIQDITPLHTIDAPIAGTGKGKLYTTLTGSWEDVVARIAVPANDTEWDKRILAALCESTTHLLFDNISRKLESASLAAALTSKIYSSRQLGATKMMAVPVNCLWAATGNNMQYSPEIQRRVVQIRLDPGVEDPSLRQNFTIPDIEGYVKEHRGIIISAGLTLVKAWLDAGRPQGTRVLGSYETWSRAMGGILDVIGVSGFLTEDRGTDTNDEVIGKAEFVWRWWLQFGEREASVRDLAELVDELDLGFYAPEDRLSTFLQFKKWMNQMTDTIVGGKKLAFVRVQSGLKCYRLQIIDKAKHAQHVLDKEVDGKGKV